MVKLIAAIGCVLALIASAAGGYWYHGARAQSTVDSSLQQTARAVIAAVVHPPSGRPTVPISPGDSFARYVRSVVSARSVAREIQVTLETNFTGTTMSVGSAGNGRLPSVGIAETVAIVSTGKSRFVTVRWQGETLRGYLAPLSVPARSGTGPLAGLVAVYELEPNDT
jgi:hypothetical protein